MARKVRPPSTSADLETASKAFRYEMRMVRHMAARLARATDPVQLNAYLESLLVHARAVVKFLYDDWQRPRDAIASDFFVDPQRWVDARGEGPTGDLDIVDRVGREIAHITFARSWQSPADKEWNIPAVVAELDRLEELLFHLGPERWVPPLPEQRGTAPLVTTPLSPSSGVAFDPHAYTAPVLYATQGRFFPDDPLDAIVKPSTTLIPD